MELVALWMIAMVIIVLIFLGALMQYIFTKDAKKKKNALDMLVVFFVLLIVGLGTCFVTLNSIKFH